MRTSRITSTISVAAALAGFLAPTAVSATLAPFAAAASSSGYTTAPTDWTPRCHRVRVCAHWAPGSVGASGSCEAWATKQACPGAMGGGN